MISIVCWLWKPTPTYRSQFGVQHVNVLRSMVARHYPHRHRFICITDQCGDPAFDPGIEQVPIWDDFANRESIYGPDTPSCYRRLRAFAGDMGAILGERFVSVDLDCVITSDMSPVWNHDKDFVIWGDLARQTPYNGSMWMMNAGARAHVWDKFKANAQKCIDKARGAGFFGSDQAWMCYALGPKENRWTVADGIFSYRTHVKPASGALPKGARIVFFQGHYDPWHPKIQASCPWIEEHYW
jgi:hypothetical protein